MLELRKYQSDTLDALRNGFAMGNRSQILYAPTGAGKTEMAIALLDAVKKKGNKAAMLLDRIVLCDQTSQRLNGYNIEHGVLQSGHWRYRPYENIQVCSAQTLEKRGDFPSLDLLIVDEAHQTRQQTMEFIKNNHRFGWLVLRLHLLPRDWAGLIPTWCPRSRPNSWWRISS